jgi:hypothetical protein
MKAIKLELTKHEANLVGLALDNLRADWVKTMQDCAQLGVDDKTTYQLVKNIDGLLERINRRGGK